MGHCPHCNSSIDDDSTCCANCGRKILSRELGKSESERVEGEGNTSERARDDDPNATVDFPSAGELTVRNEELGNTLELGTAESDSTQEVPDEPQANTIQSENTDQQRTIEFASPSPASTVDASPDTASAEDAEFELADSFGTTDSLHNESPSEQATLHIVPDGGGVAADGDDVGTVELPAGDDAPGSKTLMFDSVDTQQATHDSKEMGTEGQLKRLWEEVAGSSQNPMHSLQGLGLQASDTVFQRVATRRVSDANVQSTAATDYQIVDKLGEGAMGIVFSARQTGVNRIVALKTAKPSFQKNDDSRRRFLYEAHITADLDHSNIVPIHELGSSEEGLLFYSMKLVQGTEWSRVIHKKPREENLEIFMKVADAMAFAHSKGVIHRDLKPENTMLGRFGEVFVTDWGTAINLRKDSTTLAQPVTEGDRFITVKDASGFARNDALALHDGEKILERLQLKDIDQHNPNRLYFRRKLSQSYSASDRYRVLKVMSLAGTPCYMAPEMAAHQLPKISTRSDIYILGAILYDIAAGKPPHGGNSVTECLRTAMFNQVIKQDHDDALLTIAFKAMATDPAERYQTVEELQEAVREYRRHAESIALTERSDDLLERAVADSDYEAFSRTMFGYRDAVELWPGNAAAAVGLRKARLAFGRAAYEKRDYDLVLQTLDTQFKEEAALHSQALHAKEKSEQREASLKLLQRAVAAIVILAVFGLSGLSLVAVRQKVRAERESARATKLAQEEKLARNNEERAKLDAEQAKEAALDALAKEEAAKKVALIAEADAQKSAELARLAEAQANARAAQIQLGEYNSSLALAKSQIESFDVKAGRDLLARMKNLTSDVFLDRNPTFDTWGWNRISLLSNQDLPQVDVGARVLSSSFAANADFAAIGTAQGTIQIIAFRNNQLVELARYAEPGAKIHTLAISPDGHEVVFGFSRGNSSGLRRWSIKTAETEPVVATGNRYFQHVAFTPDGQSFVAGLNGGIWLWKCGAAWHQRDKPDARLESVRGDLLSLQSIGDQTTLLTARFQDRLLIAILDLRSSSIRRVKMREGLETQIVSAYHISQDDEVVLGLSDNRVLVATLDREQLTLTEQVALDDKHRAPVTSIVSDGGKQFITVSANEPVAHVWKNEGGKWLYDTFLTGTTGNLAGLGFMRNGEVLGIDREGHTIAWNVGRQKQRRRLERQQLSGPQGPGMGQEEYLAPVVGVYAGASDASALTIDENGIVDVWRLTNGTTNRFATARWSYIGHTPGVELVDSAIDLEQGIVVTAASLANAEKKYLENPNHAWEFCTWDLESGDMLRRWTTANRADPNGVGLETIEQRISLVDHGRQILFASDNVTLLADLQTGTPTLNKSDFGSYFAVPNPRKPSQCMLVKRSGAVRILDLSGEIDWEVPEARDYSLADPIDIPIQGVWSADGKRFYLAFSSGGLAAFEWSAGKLSLTWTSRSLDELSGNQMLRSALVSSNVRLASHLDIDLLVNESEGRDVLYMATRHRGLDAQSKLTIIQFDDANAEPRLLEDRMNSGIQWLEQTATNATPSLTSRVHDQLVVDNRRIRARARAENQVFVSTKSAQVYGLTAGQPHLISYGRARLVDSTGDRAGRVIYTLHEDGSVWKFEYSDARIGWSKASYNLLGATAMELSSDGSELLVREADSFRLLDPMSGETIHQLGELSAAAWAPQSGARLALCRRDGRLETREDGRSEVLKLEVVLHAGERVVGLHFFRETWSDGITEPRNHLLVQTENAVSGRIQLVPIEDLPPGAEVPDVIRLDNEADSERLELPRGTLITTSPTEGIFLTGAPGGTVTVWFATPTWEKNPRQLFDLEGHRGADITCLAFSNDGQTAISADSKQRLFAWLSKDPLSGPADQ